MRPSEFAFRSLRSGATVVIWAGGLIIYPTKKKARLSRVGGRAKGRNPGFEKPIRPPAAGRVSRLAA